MDWQTIATVLAGLVLPVLVQVLRRLLDGDGDKLNDWRAQVLVMVVSIALAAGIGLASGELSWDGDMLAAVTTMFTIASFLYKLFQEKLDGLLPGKE